MTGLCSTELQQFCVAAVHWTFASCYAYLIV